MKRIVRQALERKLEQTRRLALEPVDLQTRERLAEMIEELEFRLQTRSNHNGSWEEARHNHYTGII